MFQLANQLVPEPSYYHPFLYWALTCEAISSWPDKPRQPYLAPVDSSHSTSNPVWNLTIPSCPTPMARGALSLWEPVESQLSKVTVSGSVAAAAALSLSRSWFFVTPRPGSQFSAWTCQARILLGCHFPGIPGITCVSCLEGLFCPDNLGSYLPIWFSNSGS